MSDHSETPEVDALIEAHSGDAKTLGAVAMEFVTIARSLERRLAEYQAKHTAIMQEADRRYDELVQDIEQGFMQGAYARLKNLQVAERELTEAQARIAELEKVVKFLLGEEALLGFWFGERPEGQPQFWWRKHLREALKDRA